MSILVREIRKGSKYSIWALGHEENCDVLEFLINLKGENSAAYDKIKALLKYSVEHGPPKNKEKCRALVNTDGLIEFKTGDGVRIVWFWDKNHMMICSHGFIKKQQKTPKREISIAKKNKAEYEIAKKSGALVKIAVGKR